MTTYIGLDLGQLQDFTARAVVRVDDSPPPPAALRSAAAVEQSAPPQLRCVGLHRWPLKTKYASIVADMGPFLAGLPEGERWHLVIDGTGVGVAVLEQFDAADIPYEAVSIHGGQATTRADKLWRVPKQSLVAAVQIPMQDRRLTVEPPTMPYAHELRAELGNFRHTITAAAHDAYAAWREADHDDLVLALAIACWRARRRESLQQFAFGARVPSAYDDGNAIRPLSWSRPSGRGFPQ